MLLEMSLFVVEEEAFSLILLVSACFNDLFHVDIIVLRINLKVS